MVSVIEHPKPKPSLAKASVCPGSTFAESAWKASGDPQALFDIGPMPRPYLSSCLVGRDRAR